MIELLAGQRQSNETDKAAHACNDFLRLGAGRSLPALLEMYKSNINTLPATTSHQTLRKWSSCYNWAERAAIYDARLEKERREFQEQMEAKERERRIEIMETGFALTHERVLALKKLAGTLANQIWSKDGGVAPGKVWLNDVKQIGSGDNAERVDLIRFNAPLIAEFRATLDDLAKETGGRKAQSEIDLRGKLETSGDKKEDGIHIITTPNLDYRILISPLKPPDYQEQNKDINDAT